MIDRRRLLNWALAGTAGAVLNPLRVMLAAQPRPDGEEWLEAVAARKYGAFLDVRSFIPDGGSFRKARTLFQTLTGSYGAQPAEIGIAFGASSSALGHLLNGAIWEEYRIGHRIAAGMEPDDAEELRKDPLRWGASGADGVKGLRDIGVRVLACRNTMGRWSRELAAVSGEPPEAVLRKLTYGLHEGVEPVPAMIAAAVLAEARNLSYVAIG